MLTMRSLNGQSLRESVFSSDRSSFPIASSDFSLSGRWSIISYSNWKGWESIWAISSSSSSLSPMFKYLSCLNRAKISEPATYLIMLPPKFSVVIVSSKTYSTLSESIMLEFSHTFFSFGLSFNIILACSVSMKLEFKLISSMLGMYNWAKSSA
jgi:hypothetical protein